MGASQPSAWAPNYGEATSAGSQGTDSLKKKRVAFPKEGSQGTWSTQDLTETRGDLRTILRVGERRSKWRNILAGNLADTLLWVCVPVG